MAKSMNVACIIVNMPSELRQGLGLASEKVLHGGKRVSFLGHRLRACSSYPVAIMTPRGTRSQLVELLKKEKYYGCNSTWIDIFEERERVCNESTTGAMMGSASEGTFSAVIQLFETGLIAKYADVGVQYLYISLITNIGAEINSSAIGMMALKQDYELFPEITKWQRSDRGPILVRVKNGSNLFERDELSEEDLGVLDADRSRIGGTGTNTYYVKISGLMDRVGATSKAIRKKVGKGYFASMLDRLVKPVYIETRSRNGASVLCPDTRLSQLTVFLKTLYLEGAPREFLPVEYAKSRT